METYAGGGGFGPMVGDLVGLAGAVPAEAVQVVGVVVVVQPGSPVNVVVAQIGVYEPEWSIPAATYSPLHGLVPDPVPNVSILPGGFSVQVGAVQGQPGNFILIRRGS